MSVEELSLSVGHTEGHVVIEVCGEVDCHTAPSLRRP